GEYRLLFHPRQATVDCEAPQNSIPGQDQTFLAGGVPNLNIRVVEKGRVEHVLDVQKLVTTEAGQRRIIEASREEIDPDPFDVLGFKLVGPVILYCPTLPPLVHGFLVLLEHTSNQR